VTSQVRRHGYIDDGPNEGARRREPRAQAYLCRRTDEGADRSRGICKSAAMTNGRCRMRGGKYTGRPVTHGQETKAPEAN